ncbi:nucleoside deaminase [Bacteroidetes/Chlorobi group bacterium Naka2016]|jgi:tRNA(adenine34) deaminase|nr:MAG: nucleoside deaminase [Bacteroidetes/Chlorobi group bacterium Naka2016]
MDYEFFMRIALKEAIKSLKSEDVPIGAIVVKDGQIISRAHNEVEKRGDATAHAELLAIEKAIKKVGYKHLLDCIVFTTLEPCPMCAGALVLARVKTVVYSAKDPKAGAGGSVLNILSHPKLNHRIEVVSGILEEESSSLLKDFFNKLRQNNE